MQNRILIFTFSLAMWVVLNLMVGKSGLAYVLTRVSSASNTNLYWSIKDLSFQIGPTNFAKIEDHKSVKIIQDSFETWQNIPCANLSLTYQGRSTKKYADGDNQNTVSNISNGWPYQAAALAMTTASFNPSNGEIWDVDIELNSQHFSFAHHQTGTNCQGGYDLQNTVTHEIGHFLGLDHVPITDATMYSGAIACETKKRDLHQDDIDGICAIYDQENPGSIPCQDGVTFVQIGQTDSNHNTHIGLGGCQFFPTTAKGKIPVVNIILLLPLGLLWLLLRKRRSGN